ncbi:CPBP family intramembrane glutamic endopeptidase [Nannocystis sp. SCPEA4]|uniref:CPBP family intramembrane glutamic endopeptidase n=1 Tax=Nannocystis sp. SCPEA4 TaxID=2996787 RepID=UPI0022719DC7|nr:CPBP family intramembrane metalloprotease [Nannocystis sp. SCPEA4]
MSKRAGLTLTIIAAQVAYVFGLRHSGLDPVDDPFLRGVVIHGPMLTIAVVGLLLALQCGLFTREELGLRMPDWTTLRGRVGQVLLLVAIFLAGALIDMAGPLGTMLSNGMSYEEIVDHLRRHEYRYVYGRTEPPLSAWNIGLGAVKKMVLPPLTEEIPYRALLLPVLLSKMSRGWAALLSGLVFFLVHWLGYGSQPHPAYFLSGWVFAWAFMLVGLPGSIAAHAGENSGVVVLGTFAAFAQSG